MEGKAHVQIDEQMRECIEECHSCHDICTETVTHCLEMGDGHAAPDHIRVLLEILLANLRKSMQGQGSR
jgi:hypothetical protein